MLIFTASSLAHRGIETRKVEMHNPGHDYSYNCKRRPHLWKKHWPLWWIHGLYDYPYRYNQKCPHRYKKQPETARASDDKGFTYWQVYNATDRTLQFRTEEGSATLNPGEKAKIKRGRSFGFAITSQDGKLLKEGGTKKHFVTIFHKGYATDYTNKKGKWRSYGQTIKPKTKIIKPKKVKVRISRQYNLKEKK